MSHKVAIYDLIIGTLTSSGGLITIIIILHSMSDFESPVFIVDNSEDGDTDKVSGYLKDWCEISSQFDIATGYFGIGALTKLDGEWEKLDKLRILIGDQVDKPTYETLLKGVRDRLDEAFDNEKTFFHTSQIQDRFHYKL